MILYMSKLSRALFRLYSLLPGKPFYGLLYPLYVRYRGLDKRRNVIARIDGITYELDLTQYIDSTIYLQGSFEAETAAVMERLVEPGMVVLDIGANIGSHTFRLARLVGQNGLVIAFEPMLAAYNQLCRNAQLNSFKNLMLEKIALGNENGTLRAAFRSSWSLFDKDLDHEPEELSIMRIDDYIKNKGIGRVDFIKLDVDGYEYKVLQGASNTLSDKRPLIVMEFAFWTLERVGDNASDLLNYLELFGYQFFSGANFDQLICKNELLNTNAINTTINILCRSEGHNV